MKRALYIAIGIVAAIVSVLGAAFWFIAYTDPGKSCLISLLEPRIANALGGEVTIGSLDGALPGEVILKDITLSNQQISWLTVNETYVKWNPLALFKGEIVIKALVIDELSVLRAPPEKQASPAPLKGFEIPDRLPTLRIDSFLLRDAQLSEAAFGTNLQLQGSGSLRTGGRDLHARIDLVTTPQGDRASLLIDRNVETNNLKIDINVKSPADGFASSLARFNGPIELSMLGNAPANDFRLNVHGEFASYGALTGHLSADLQSRTAIAASLNFRFGEALNSLSDKLGETIAIDAIVNPMPRGMSVDIKNLLTPTFESTGKFLWKNKNGILDSAEIEGTISLKGEAFSNIRKYFGDSFKLDISTTLQDAATYQLNAEITSPFSNISFKRVRSNFKNYFEGATSFELTANDAWPGPLADGATGSAVTLLRLGDRLSLSEIEIAIPSRTEIEGHTDYIFNDSSFTAALAFKAFPLLIEETYPDLTAAKSVDGGVAARGTIEDLHVDVRAQLPAFQLNGRQLPAADLVADLSGFLDSYKGNIRIKAVEGINRLEADFESRAKNIIDVPRIHYSGDGFLLNGSASFDRPAQTGSFRLSYSGEDSAQPIPGEVIAGEFSAHGNFADTQNENLLTIDSEHLRVGDTRFEKLRLEATGPSSAINFTLRADNVVYGDDLIIENIKTVSTLNIQAEKLALVDSLSFLLNDIPINLVQPVTLSIGNAIKVSALKLDVGASGEIAFDGSFSRQRWVGALSARSAPIPGAIAMLDLDVDFDTDRQDVADGTFTLSTGLTAAETGKINGAFAWNGNDIRLTDGSDTETFEMDIVLPLLLRQTDGLSVTLDGDIAGAISYRGDLEALAAFFPPMLQVVEGPVSLSAKIGGDIRNPSVDGAVSVERGAYTEPRSGLSIVNIDLSGKIKKVPSGIRVEFDGAARGPGQDRQSITVNGFADLAQNSAVKILANLDKAKFSAGPVTSASASGVFSLKGSFDDLQATGDMTVHELNAETRTPPRTGLVNIEVVKLNSAGQNTGAKQAKKRAPSIPVDGKILANDKVFIRGRGLESEWSADVKVSGALDAPLLIGVLDNRRGYFDFAGRRFNITRGRISFDKLSPNNPAIDIRAEVEANNVTAIIIISGRADNVSVKLESSPTLPNNDILAYLLFGKPANTLSAQEAFQVASAFASLAAIGPFGNGGEGLFGAARQTLGLDLLSIDAGDENEAASLTVGKYVTDGLFVSATQDARSENSSVRVQYEINNNLTIETEVGQDGDQTISANWKHDF